MVLSSNERVLHFIVRDLPDIIHPEGRTALARSVSASVKPACEPLYAGRAPHENLRVGSSGASAWHSRERRVG